MNNKKDINNLDLNLLSSIIFICTSLVSLFLTFEDKKLINRKETFITKKQSLNISFYNRIVIIVAVIISLYVGYDNLKNESNKRAKYKSELLFFTNILSVVGAIIILYVSYLNKKEQSITVSDVENPLI